MLLATIFGWTVGLLVVPMRVNPGSFWAVYTLENQAELPLPAGASVQPVRIFPDSPPRKLLLFNEYEARSPFFGGRRLEANVIVRIRGRTHFVVLECISDALGWDPERGVHLPNAAVYQHRETPRLTTSIRSSSGEHFTVDGALDKRDRRITPDFAVRPNWECFFRDHPRSVRLEFDPDELCQPVHLVNATVDTSILPRFKGQHLFSFVHPNEMNFVMTVE